MIVPVTAALGAGVVIGWLLHAYGPPRPATLDQPDIVHRVEAAHAEGEPEREPARLRAAPYSWPSPVVPTVAKPATVESADAVETLRDRDLRLPVDGVKVETLKDHFAQSRSGAGAHRHEAVDILAPRSTPVHAVTDGTIAKIFESQAGGHTVYQFDGEGRFAYYYAHLERYANGLSDGMKVSEGDIIGYVGTSGNAPPNTPHLHFAILELDQEKRWWKGRAIDPYLVFR